MDLTGLVLEFIFFGGLVLCAFGVYLIYPPFSFMFAGFLLMGFTFRASRTYQEHRQAKLEIEARDGN